MRSRWFSTICASEMTINAQPRRFLTDLFHAAIEAADPLKAMAPHLPERPKGRTIVVGAGKGAAQMAAALERLWDEPLEGVVVTRYGYGCPTRSIEVLEAAHPVPDEAGLSAAERLISTVAGLTADDLVIALVCGGGSALLPAPPEGLTLADEIAVQQSLLASGAPIGAMNTIRKHLSRIKGGRLAAVTRARAHTMLISDIPGDDPALVASGPTIPDHRDRQEALDIVARYDLALPASVLEHLQSAKADAPRPSDSVFARHTHAIIASSSLSLEAAAQAAEKRGIEAVILSDAIEGEAQEIARMHAAIARETRARGRPFSAPVVLLSGGETTVTVRNRNGKGGRNSAFALSFALAIEDVEGITLLAADTDGIDGTEDNAGAFVDGGTAERIRKHRLDPARMLADNLSHPALEAADALFVTGPTGTNINDFRAILIDA